MGAVTAGMCLLNIWAHHRFDRDGFRMSVIGPDCNDPGLRRQQLRRLDLESTRRNVPFPIFATLLGGGSASARLQRQVAMVMLAAAQAGRMTGLLRGAVGRPRRPQVMELASSQSPTPAGRLVEVGPPALTDPPAPITQQRGDLRIPAITDTRSG